MSNIQNPDDIPLDWLVNRDPYNGSLSSLYNWLVQSANPTNRGEVITAQNAQMGFNLLTSQTTHHKHLW